MISLPDYPKECSDKNWISAKGKIDDKPLGIQTKLIDLENKYKLLKGTALPSMNRLEEAIKAKKGVQPAYADLGDKHYPHIENYKKAADSFNKFSAKAGDDLKKSKDSAKAGDWLLASGKAAVKHAGEIDKLGEGLLEKAENIPPETMVDLKRELTHWDVNKLLTGLGIKLTTIQLTPGKEAFIIIEGQVGDVMTRNATLFQLFYDAGWAEAQRVGAILKSALEGIDGKLKAGTITLSQADSLIAGAYKQFDSAIQTQAAIAVTKEWDKYLKEHVEYRNYKIKATLRVTAQSAGIVAGVASIAGAGWTGAGTVLGVIALSKSVMTLGREIAILAVAADTLGKKIDKDIKALQVAYAADSKNLVGGKELAAAALGRLTGFQKNSVPVIEKDTGTFENKLKGCKDTAVLAGAKVNPLLSEISATRAKIRKAAEQMKDVPKVKAALAKLDGVLTKQEAAVNKLLIAISGKMESYNKGQVSAKTFKELTVVLKGGIPKWSDKLQKYAVPFLDFATVADISGAVTTAGSVLVELAATATETTDEIESASSASQILGSTKDLVLAFIPS